MKKTICLYGLLLSGILFTGYKLCFLNTEELNIVHKYVLSDVLHRWSYVLSPLNHEDRILIKYDSLMNALPFYEKFIIRKIFGLSPSDLNVFLTGRSDKCLDNLVKHKAIVYSDLNIAEGELIAYIPETIFKDYLSMYERMKKEINMELLVNSAYRSKGYQAYLFIYYLVTTHGFSIKENVKWVTLPGYSEHNDGNNTAIDFILQKGILLNSDNIELLENSKSFKWLCKNANKYNFYLSYPRKNSINMAFEPWHWHWSKSPPG